MPVLASPTISIITVTFQAAAVLEETILSVINQSWTDWEYIIVDGGSTDGTIDIIRKYENTPGLSWISEKDQGLYDAMNKGIKMANGKWLYFMNAGDLLYDTHVLERIFSSPPSPDVNLIYGQIYFKNHPSGVDYVGQKKIAYKDYFFSIPLCHQAAFIQKSCFEKLGLYQLSYKILADQEWFVRYFKLGDQSLYVPMIVASYEIVGLSQKQRFKSMAENQRISKNHFPFWVYILRILRHPFIWLKVYIMMKIMHTGLYSIYRKVFHQGIKLPNR